MQWVTKLCTPLARPVQHTSAWRWPQDMCQRCKQWSSTGQWHTFTKLLNQEVEPPAPNSSMTWWGLQSVRNSTQTLHCTFSGRHGQLEGLSASMQAHSKKVSTVTTSSKLIHTCEGKCKVQHQLISPF